MGDVSSVNRYRQYAADCVRQAQDEDAPEDKTIMLNVALAWLRLAQQQSQASHPGESQPGPSELAQHELAS